MNTYLHFHSYLNTDMVPFVEILPHGRQGPFFPAYHGCWWPGDARSQDISSHDIHLVFPEYSSFCVRRVNSALAAQEGLTFHIAWYLWCSKFIWSFQLYSRDALTHCPLGNLGVILKMQFSIIFYLSHVSVSSDFLIMMPSDECYRPLLMISQHWFR